MIVEQFKLGSMIDDDVKPKKQWNYPLQNVLAANSAVLTEGIHQVNIMLLGCIANNQEGLFIKADRPYYDQFEDKFRPIKLKARMEFAVKVNDADTKVERLEDRSLGFESKPFVYLPPDILQATPAADASVEIVRREGRKPLKFEFKVKG